MQPNTKFYKIKILKEFLAETAKARQALLNELITNATDPVIVKRRYRMLRHLALYENQIIEKIQNFETDNVTDIVDSLDYANLSNILNRSA